MALERTDPIAINRIRRAGLVNVRNAALASGLLPQRVARDIAILKAVANSSRTQAAEKLQVSRSCVDYAIKKYEGFALKILEETNG